MVSTTVLAQCLSQVTSSGSRTQPHLTVLFQLRRHGWLSQMTSLAGSRAHLAALLVELRWQALPRSCVPASVLFNHRLPICMCGRVCRTRDIRFSVGVVARECCLVGLGHDPSSCATLVSTRGARLTLGCSLPLISCREVLASAAAVAQCLCA